MEKINPSKGAILANLIAAAQNAQRALLGPDLWSYGYTNRLPDSVTAESVLAVLDDLVGDLCHAADYLDFLSKLYVDSPDAEWYWGQSERALEMVEKLQEGARLYREHFGEGGAR